MNKCTREDHEAVQLSLASGRGCCVASRAVSRSVWERLRRKGDI